MMRNLLIETKNILAEHGHSLEDVTFIGCREFAIPLESFKTLADVEYDSGFGAQNVAEDLIVVGPYWWLERHEYDGSEWWEYKEKPQIPNRVKCPKSLFAQGVGWETLSCLCKEDGKEVADMAIEAFGKDTDVPSMEEFMYGQDMGSPEDGR